MVKLKRLYKPINKVALRGADAFLSTDGEVSIEKINDKSVGLTFYDQLTVFNEKCVPKKIDSSNRYVNPNGELCYKNYMRFWVAKSTPETLTTPHMYRLDGNEGKNWGGSTLQDIIEYTNDSLENRREVYLVYEMTEDDFYKPMVDWKTAIDLMDWKAKKQMKGFNTVAPQRKRATPKKRTPAVRVDVRKMF